MSITNFKFFKEISSIWYFFDFPLLPQTEKASVTALKAKPRRDLLHRAKRSVTTTPHS